ncbi:MAG: hypothetical protein GF409_03190 [Candidatus Omnitrophica bacterium]|nr:hypothetical protein [Candidatus Omnitrophota bacterium]
MKLHKIIFTGIFITLLAIGYVHQKVEIVKTGYSIQRNRDHLSCLIDQNSQLMYNLSKLESPKNLLTSMNGEEIEFARETIRQTNSYRIAQVETDGNYDSQGFIGRFLDIFTVNAEAEPRQ